jgi:hypothetical protein
MKKNSNWLFLCFLLGSITLTSCLHIIEEVTFRNDGRGQYKMTLDMSELKGMMDMFKGMAQDSTTMGGDSTATDAGMGDMGALGGQDNSMTQMGQEMVKVAESLKNIPGITNVMETNDTTNFQFGYTFDFADVAALNRALKVINKEKYESKTEEVYVFSGKKFERLPTGDIGAELKKAMGETGGDDEEGSMEMVKMFFADMSYEQIYNFPDRVIKKNDNELAEISNGGHTMKIKLKPFDEEQQKKNVTVATKVKLK